MYFETEDLLLLDLEQGVKEFLEKSDRAYMAMHSRSKSFRVLQYMKKKFPNNIVERSFNDEDVIYLITIREKYETV